MPEKISIEESKLRDLLKNEATQNEALKTYFYLDESQPFRVEYKLKENVVIVPPLKGVHIFSVSGIIMDIVNNIERFRRRRIYEENKNNFPERICAVSEGDSWFQHPLIEDIIDHLLNHFNIYCLASAGAKLSNMFRVNEYAGAIESEDPKVLLLSGGGNDIFGENFQNFLNHYTPGSNVKRLINDKFYEKLGDINNLYDAFALEMQKEYPKLKIIVHAYDYIIPRSLNDGKWVGKYMYQKDILDPDDQKAIIKEMVGAFNDYLDSLAGKYSNVVYVDLRGSVHHDQWYDEIHPDDKGFQQAALRIMQRIYTIK